MNTMKSIFHEISKIDGISSVYVDPIPKEILARVKKNHELSRYTELLFCCEDWIYDSSDSLVITSQELSIFFNNELKNYYWTDIDSVEYKYEDSSFYFIFKLNNKNTGLKIAPNFFGIFEMAYPDAPLCVSFLHLLNRFVKRAHKINKTYEQILEELATLEEQMSKLDEIDIQKLVVKIIAIYDNYINTTGEKVIDSRLEYYLVMALCLKKENSEALKIINNLFENYENEINLEFWYRVKAEILEELNIDYDAILYHKKAYNLCSDTIEKLKYKDEINEIQNRFNLNFIDLPYQKRKLILIDDDLKSTPEDTFIVLDKNKLPQNLKFPNNNPKKEELYILHPYIKDIYMPYSDYEVTLFRDKFEEFSYLIQCLGAKSMTITVAKGSKNSRSNLINLSSHKDNQKTIDGSIGFKGVGINGNYKDTKSYNSNKISNQDDIKEDETSYSRTQIFNPTKKPYLPSDMIWFENESSWQRLYKQRTTGNIMHHHDVLSSKSNYSISEKEEIALKEAFTNHIGGGVSYQIVNANGGLSTEKNKKITELIESTFSQSETIQWEIVIEFESIDSLTEDAKNVNFTTNTQENPLDFEQQYQDEVKFMLEDGGVIDDKERRILERFRVRKGISKQRAAELEKIVFTFGDLSENEKEYLDEYQELLNDGEITEKERRILNRFATRLELTEERILQLENSLC